MGPNELVRLIGDSPFFGGLEPDERMVFAREGQLVEHLPGEAVFEPRTAPEALWLVVRGLVEICRRSDPLATLEPVAYMGPGSLVGENKVITGTAYQSLARFPEGGTTIRWPRQAILRRLGVSSHFSMHYLHHLARRLEGTFSSLGRDGAKLEGQLDHFDLETILQTVVGSSATGVLEVNDGTGRKYGSVYTDQGLVGPVLCGRLVGEEAFLEILTHRPQHGAFCFTPLKAARETSELFQLQPLLLESARISDEYRRFTSTVPAGAVFRPLTRRPGWVTADDASLRNRVWHVVGAAPSSIDDLVERLPFSRARLSLVVKEMLLAGELSIEAPARPSDSWAAEGL